MTPVYGAVFAEDECECKHTRFSHSPTGCFYVENGPHGKRCGCDRFRLRAIHQAEHCTPAERWHSPDPDFDRIIRRCLEVLKAKGADYTIGNLNGDRLHNFRTAGTFCGMTPAQALGVYLYKHLSAIFAYINLGKVESEPIEERIVDAINYLLLLGKLVAEPKKEPG